ncbi:MAG: hypothetical protein IT233_05585 [Bacteroidia bacterium]|nr:hypothetical protein [Bacteroidia bacterium]
MKRKLFLRSLFGALALSLVLVSCQPDDPEPTPTDDRDKFVGSWTCQESSSQTGNSTFTVHINKSATSSSQIEIENLYNAGFSNKATANVSGNNFSASNQPYTSFIITSLSGNSTGSTTLTMNYIIQNGSIYDTCSANCTKQ